MAIRADMITTWWEYFVSTATTDARGQPKTSDKKVLEDAGYVIFTSTGGGDGGRDMVTGRPTNGRAHQNRAVVSARPTSTRRNATGAKLGTIRRLAQNCAYQFLHVRYTIPFSF